MLFSLPRLSKFSRNNFLENIWIFVWGLFHCLSLSDSCSLTQTLSHSNTLWVTCSLPLSLSPSLPLSLSPSLPLSLSPSLPLSPKRPTIFSRKRRTRRFGFRRGRIENADGSRSAGASRTVAGSRRRQAPATALWAQELRDGGHPVERQSDPFEQHDPEEKVSSWTKFN